MIDPMYTLKSVRESEKHFDEPIEFFVKQMRANEGQVVDMAPWMVSFAVDAFTSMTYGERYGYLEKGSAPEMSNYVDNNWFPYTWLVTLTPILGWLQRRIQNFILVVKVVAKGGKPPLAILGWVAQRIEKEIASSKELGEAPTLLERTVKLHRDHPKEFTETMVGTHMVSLLKCLECPL